MQGLTALNTIRELLRRHNASPKKSLGQNFLINRGVLEKVVRAADLTRQDTVLEVGPGIGTLTRELAKKAGSVVAVEKDAKMVEILKETLADFPNVKLVHADILSLVTPPKPGLGGVLGGGYKVVANLPYYITSPVIRLFLEGARRRGRALTHVSSEALAKEGGALTKKPNFKENGPLPRPQLLVLMVQKEVAQRICAKPPDMNILALSVQFYGTTKIEGVVKKGSFWPRPDVDSALLKITPHQQEPRLKTHGREFLAADRFFQVVKAGFLHPRRRVSSNLAQGLGLKKEEVERLLQQHGISPSQRPETLSLEDWLSLCGKLSRT